MKFEPFCFSLDEVQELQAIFLEVFYYNPGQKCWENKAFVPRKCFSPPLPQINVELEESPPWESLGPGSISKVDNIDMGGVGGDQLTFSEKSRFSKQNSQDIFPGL